MGPIVAMTSRNAVNEERASQAPQSDRPKATEGPSPIERRSGLLRAGASLGKEKKLRHWRAANEFRLWTRVVLSLDDDRRFGQWAVRHEGEYMALVRCYGESKDVRAREKLLNKIQDILWNSEARSFDPTFEDWNEEKDE